MKKIKIVYIPFIALMLSGCQKIFDADIESTDKLILVVESSLTNTDGPHWVSLNYAGKLDDDHHFNPAYCDHVSILDNLGNKTILKSKSLGYYTTGKGELTGVPGRKYKLRLTFGNGLIYESFEETMPEPIEEIQTIPEWGHQVQINKNSYGDLIERRQEGVFVKLNIHYVDHEMLVLIKTTYLSQMLSYIEAVPFPINYYCWSVKDIRELPMIERSLEQFNSYHIKNVDVGFLPYEFTPKSMNDDDTLSAPVPVGWVIAYDVYNLTKSNYLFYEDLKEQLEGKNYIFDPVPSQLTGNMHCITDDNMLVTGSFEVKTHKRFFRAFKKNYNSIESKILDTYEFPNVDSCQSAIEPEFWVNF